MPGVAQEAIEDGVKTQLSTGERKALVSIVVGFGTAHLDRVVGVAERQTFDDQKIHSDVFAQQKAEEVVVADKDIFAVGFFRHFADFSHAAP